MDNKSIIQAAIFSLLAILAVAFINFIIITYGVKKTYDQSLKTIERLEMAIVDNTSLNKYQIKKLTHQNDEFKKYLSNMEALKKGIFDSNTITFMASFLLVFLGGILLGIDKRAREKIIESNQIITEAEKCLNQTEIKVNTLDLYTQILMIKTLTTNAQSIFASNDYTINNLINIQFYEIFKATDVLISDQFRKDKYKLITVRWKKSLIDILDRMIYAFEIERIKENPNNVRKTAIVEKIIRKLEELRDKIFEIDEIDEIG